MAHILIVEDNELNRDMLSRRLERRGFEVSIAVDGQEGLDQPEGQDVEIPDHDLPSMISPERLEPMLQLNPVGDGSDDLDK
ncbi:MAG: hypothetical protein VXW20_06820, partial [Pseudomonadota bacterium]|nr:hypothetical protein [Pseudomonadota bacterium]